jgi:hypothetical protein
MERVGLGLGGRERERVGERWRWVQGGDPRTFLQQRRAAVVQALGVLAGLFSFGKRGRRGEERGRYWFAVVCYGGGGEEGQERCGGEGLHVDGV